MRPGIHARFSAGLLACASLLPLTAFGAADATRGGQLYTARCGACHSIDDNGPGPKHRGLFGCRAATQPGYDYSDALKQSRIVWDAAALDRWLADPNALAPGNKMVVKLASDPQDRADLIAYLQVATGGTSTCERPAGADRPHPVATNLWALPFASGRECGCSTHRST
jgi:cytochrome c